MKRILLFSLILTLSTCAQAPILSDLVNDRITLKLMGTYESNDPYAWNTNLYTDDQLTMYGLPVTKTVPFSNLDMYIDIADIRLATGTGKPSSTPADQYWTYFTRNREVFCSSNKSPAGYDLVSCRNNNGLSNYSNFFSGGYDYPAADVPAGTYHHVAINFRKFVTAPSILYDITGNNPSIQTTLFDNRVVNGLNLTDTILQFLATDTANNNPLMAPLQRTDLNLQIPDGKDPYVLEIRIFIKNLLMNHLITHGNFLETGSTAATPKTLVGISDWNADHNTSVADTSAFQMGGSLIFTARVYKPSEVGSIIITDTTPLPTYKTYYAVMASGSGWNGVGIPFAATKASSTGGTIKNLPPGAYDIYRTCDKFSMQSGGLLAGEDGYPETISTVCGTVTVTTGNSVTSSDITACTCP